MRRPWVRGVFLSSRGLLDKGYSDTMAFIGLTKREALVDFEDYYRRRPEDFVGRNVLVLGASEAARWALRGRRLVRVIYTERFWQSPVALEASRNADIAMFGTRL